MSSRKRQMIAQQIRDQFAKTYRGDEAECLTAMLPLARMEEHAYDRAAHRAKKWIEQIRASEKSIPAVSEMLSKFGLSSAEGIAMMCLAEALLRIPDKSTAEALIHDKLTEQDWSNILGKDDGWLLGAAGWGLKLTGKLVGLDKALAFSPGQAIGSLVSKFSQNVVREAMQHVIKWMADQFVLGETMKDACARSKKLVDQKSRISFDMLGEGARTMKDAERYFISYADAIKTAGLFNRSNPRAAVSGISVKLSAFHPRYEATQSERVLTELVPKVIHLAELAAQEKMFMIIDAEEADRLSLSLDVLDETLAHGKFADWEGLGLAVQAYQKRALATIDKVAALAKLHNRRLIVRLVKGAYWDTEIKRAQERGLADYPVFTRKATTDVSYLACARKILEANTWIQPMFGTHNALTIASIIEMAREDNRLEFQRLHGMGEELYKHVKQLGYRTCIYAPVGDHSTLLAYLVRRMLENGANSSFVNQLYNPHIPIESLVANPVALMESTKPVQHPAICLPSQLYAPERINSPGVDVTNPPEIFPLMDKVKLAAAQVYTSAPIIDGKLYPNKALYEHGPGEKGKTVGRITPATMEQADEAMECAHKAFPAWTIRSVAERAACLEKLADLILERKHEFLALLIHGGGKTVVDGLNEIREAVDFCRYYAARARFDFQTHELPGPTGETNLYSMHGRGVFVCISPWNFPLAIFLGQVAAALVAGNTVVAKPAPQTPLIAALTVLTAFEAGIPNGALQLITGGADIGERLVSSLYCSGVAFTGSVAAAQKINRTLAARDGPIAPLIAETGGQNAMIVDTSALPEQVVDDVVTSAFRSAGQRCSALRVLYLPEDTAVKITSMLIGAMQELKVGHPALLSTDVGPMIDRAAVQRLEMHVEKLRAEASEIYTLPLPSDCKDGNYFSPQVWEIQNIRWLEGEVFGPILHIIRYHPDNLIQVFDDIHSTGFGLTGGIHTRLDSMMEKARDFMPVGNLYINRSMIGAVVGSQPFGGHGLSGTGPKAGGPLYLHRFAVERVTSINTAAAGGNTTLLMQIK